jgi:ABC-type multidrug transport system fused ATPase/permease subunit
VLRDTSTSRKLIKTGAAVLPEKRSGLLAKRDSKWIRSNAATLARVIRESTLASTIGLRHAPDRSHRTLHPAPRAQRIARGGDMIELQDVRKTYGNRHKVHALREVDLTIEDGGFVGVISPTGSGSYQRSTIRRHVDTTV